MATAICIVYVQLDIELTMAMSLSGRSWLVLLCIACCVAVGVVILCMTTSGDQPIRDSLVKAKDKAVDRLARELMEGSGRGADLRRVIAEYAKDLRDDGGNIIVLEITEAGIVIRSPGLDRKLHTADDYCRVIPK